MQRITVFTLALLTKGLFATLACGQVWSITEPNITACSGVLYDTGGALGDYGDGESFTTVLCPDQPEAKVLVAFNDFNLSGEGIGQSDSLAIYDGPSVSDPLIGTFTGIQLAGHAIAASPQNPSGCLTLVFNSNEVGTGNFEVAVMCILPCPAPTALFTASHPEPAQLCAGDSLLLDASASILAGPTGLSHYSWTTSNSVSDITRSPYDTLVFTNPGIYLLQLQVMDSMGCSSTPTAPWRVLVSAPAHFEGTEALSSICLGTTAAFAGSAVPELLLDTLDAEVDYGSGLEIPDGTIPIISTITITWADEGSLVIDPVQLGDICLGLEHSFMGDLSVRLECPNGQSALLHQPWSSNNTFLGMPYDGQPDSQPGACWTYCFNTQPDHGTWEECANNGTTPNVIPVDDWFTLAPGSYATEQPLSDLIGCPVNGIWTLHLQDTWPADNGFLCSWSMGLVPTVDSNYVDLSPTISLQHPDSAFWSGPGVVADPDIPALAELAVAALDAYLLTFHVVDSYGCAYDTTISVQAPNLVLDQVTGPAEAAPLSLLTYTALPELPSADSISWAIPFGWNWNDPITTDAEAILQSPELPGSYTICASAYQDGCASEQVCSVIDVALGLNEHDARVDDLFIYPNPTDDLLFIQLPAAGTFTELSIVDMLGRCVVQNIIVGDPTASQIDIRHLIAGRYRLSIRTTEVIRSALLTVIR